MDQRETLPLASGSLPGGGLALGPTPASYRACCPRQLHLTPDPRSLALAAPYPHGHGSTSGGGMRSKDKSATTPKWGHIYDESRR